MTNLTCTVRTPIDGQRWPIGVITGGGGRTVITVRRPCGIFVSM